MLSLLTRPLPSSVDVGGRAVSVNSGYRTGLMASALPDDGDGRARLLWLLFADRRSGRLRDGVAGHEAEALAAGAEWLDGAWGSFPYGSGRKEPRGRRLWDWDADAGVVCCDFQRLYGLDLTSASTQMHWYRFVALAAGAMRTEGSLSGAASSSRVPPRRGASRQEREALARRAEAWALPPTDEELRERARREF